MQIHYYGDYPPGVTPEAGKVGVVSAGGLGAASSGVGLTRPGGSAAFLDIHYHGSSVGDLATNPAGGLAKPGGSAAFLDIHYHGSSAGDVARGGARPESGAADDGGEETGSIHIYGP